MLPKQWQERSHWLSRVVQCYLNNDSKGLIGLVGLCNATKTTTVKVSLA